MDSRLRKAKEAGGLTHGHATAGRVAALDEGDGSCHAAHAFLVDLRLECWGRFGCYQ